MTKKRGNRLDTRVMVNLFFFASLGVLLCIWAVSNVLQMDVLNPPYEITADFEDSPGLQSGFDVGYLGTPIGRIRAVDLEDGHVRVTLAIEDGRQIPEGSSLAVRRKSAVGEPYVDVVPPEGVGRDGPFLEEGAHIPIDRTQTPLSYSELFDALNDLVSSIPEDDLATIFDEMATGLDGRADSFRQMITGGDDALETFAENSELMEEFTANMARLVTTMAEHRDSLGAGLENSELITRSLADANADITRVLESGNSLATRTADLLAENKPEVTCFFHGLGELVVRLGEPETLAALSNILATGPRADHVFDDVVAHEADGNYIRAIPPLNVGGEGEDAPVYAEPTQLPAIPAPVGCDASGAEAAPAGAGAAGPDGTAESAATSPAVDPGPDADLAPNLASSDDEVGGSGFNPLWIVAALLATGLISATRPWRWLPGRGK